MAFETEGAQDVDAPKGRVPDQEAMMRCETRSTTRSKNLTIPSPAELTDSDEENINSYAMLIINRPHGSALSPYAFLGNLLVAACLN
jgi:hypothetical protein